LLRIPWTARRTNAPVIKQIKQQHSLETLDVTGKLNYFRKIMRRSDILEKDLMFGLTDGNRGRRRQRTRWTEGIRGTLKINYYRAKQNAMEGPDLQGRQKEEMTKRKRLRDSKTQHFC
jgi:hypothetical protein